MICVYWFVCVSLSLHLSLSLCIPRTTTTFNVCAPSFTNRKTRANDTQKKRRIIFISFCLCHSLYHSVRLYRVSVSLVRECPFRYEANKQIHIAEKRIVSHSLYIEESVCMIVARVREPAERFRARSRSEKCETIQTYNIKIEGFNSVSIVPLNRSKFCYMRSEKL